MKCRPWECVFKSFISLFGCRQRVNEAGAVFRCHWCLHASCSAW